MFFIKSEFEKLIIDTRQGLIGRDLRIYAATFESYRNSNEFEAYNEEQKERFVRAV